MGGFASTPTDKNTGVIELRFQPSRPKLCGRSRNFVHVSSAVKMRAKFPPHFEGRVDAATWRRLANELRHRVQLYDCDERRLYQRFLRYVVWCCITMLTCITPALVMLVLGGSTGSLGLLAAGAIFGGLFFVATVGMVSFFFCLMPAAVQGWVRGVYSELQTFLPELEPQYPGLVVRAPLKDTGGATPQLDVCRVLVHIFDGSSSQYHLQHLQRGLSRTSVRDVHVAGAPRGMSFANLPSQASDGRIAVEMAQFAGDNGNRSSGSSGGHGKASPHASPHGSPHGSPHHHGGHSSSRALVGGSPAAPLSSSSSFRGSHTHAHHPLAHQDQAQLNNAAARHHPHTRNYSSNSVPGRPSSRSSGMLPHQHHASGLPRSSTPGPLMHAQQQHGGALSHPPLGASGNINGAGGSGRPASRSGGSLRAIMQQNGSRQNMMVRKQAPHSHHGGGAPNMSRGKVVVSPRSHPAAYAIQRQKSHPHPHAHSSPRRLQQQPGGGGGGSPQEQRRPHTLGRQAAASGSPNFHRHASVPLPLAHQKSISDLDPFDENEAGEEPGAAANAPRDPKKRPSAPFPTDALPPPPHLAAPEAPKPRRGSADGIHAVLKADAERDRSPAPDDPYVVASSMPTITPPPILA